MPSLGKISVLCAGTLLFAPPMAAEGAWSPCGGAREPQALWRCWSAGEDKVGGCVPKTACPPRDQNDKPVLSCYYEKSFSTGYRCILFCNYGGAFPWGSDGGTHCD
jgi:hypothetical protein